VAIEAEKNLSKPVTVEPIKKDSSSEEPKVSALSLSSIRAKKALEESNKSM
jgi:hypothetical protein